MTFSWLPHYLITAYPSLISGPAAWRPAFRWVTSIPYHVSKSSDSISTSDAISSILIADQHVSCISGPAAGIFSSREYKHSHPTSVDRQRGIYHHHTHTTTAFVKWGLPRCHSNRMLVCLLQWSCVSSSCFRRRSCVILIRDSTRVRILKRVSSSTPINCIDSRQAIHSARFWTSNSRKHKLCLYSWLGLCCKGKARRWAKALCIPRLSVPSENAVKKIYCIQTLGLKSFLNVFFTSS